MLWYALFIQYCYRKKRQSTSSSHSCHSTNIGLDEILKRRNKTFLDKNLSNGPGKVCKSLGITKAHNALSLTKNEIWLEESNVITKNSTIETTPRIGIDYAEEDKYLPWRFVLKI